MQTRYHLDIPQLKSLETIEIVQIGRLHCSPETVVKRHQHLGWYELTVATEGLGTVYTGDVPTPVTTGDIYFSYPWDAHAITTDQATPLKYDFFAFRPKDPAWCKALEEAVQRRPGADVRVIRDDRIGHLITNAIAEYCALRDNSSRLLEAMFVQLITYLIRDLESLPSAKPKNHVSSADALCFRIMHYVDTHLYSLKNLQELADITGYHYSHLSALFHNTTGSTLHQYWQTKRLEAARLLIREDQRKISEIADILGYSSVFAFSKAYRKHFQYPPSKEPTDPSSVL